MTGGHFLLCADPVLGAGPSDRCLIDFSSFWEKRQVVEPFDNCRKEGSIRGSDRHTLQGLVKPPPPCIWTLGSVLVCLVTGVSQRHHYYHCLETTWLGTSLGLSCISAGLLYIGLQTCKAVSDYSVQKWFPQSSLGVVWCSRSDKQPWWVSLTA